MMIPFKKTTLLSALVLAGAANSPLSQAQSESRVTNLALEEVVVTAQKRAEDSQDVPVADDREDRHGFVRGIDDETLVVVTDDPNVVVNLPRAAVELENPGGHDAFDADATRRDGEDGMGVGHAAYLFVSEGQSRTTTERSTSPSCILVKAASTSPMPIFSVTKAPRSKRPCL